MTTTADYLPATLMGLLPKFSIALFLAFFSDAYADAANAKTTTYDLLLAGGGLGTCSSTAIKHCSKNVFNSQQKFHTSYHITPENLAKLQLTGAYQRLPAQQQKHLNAVLANIQADYTAADAGAATTAASAVIDYRELREQFARQGFLELWQTLPDDAYFALLDSHENPQLHSTGANRGQRKRELVSLTHTQNPAAAAIFREFVAQAQLRLPRDQAPQKPLIAVVTASARDPYAAVDFYLSAFTAAGAEALWLPLDASYQEARHLQQHYGIGCANLAEIRAKRQLFYREHLYPGLTAKQTRYCQQPSLMLDDISKVQGIFFNGGDQSLTLAALLTATGDPSPELQLLHQRMAAGELIIGGTSAGTAVQAGGRSQVGGRSTPIAMLTNGHSRNALSRGAFGTPPPSQRCGKTVCANGLHPDDLTYRGAGGSGLFQLGLLDTHFSERNREARLSMFAAATQQRFAFGVDEATALLVRNPLGRPSPDKETAVAELKVIGAGGVFIVDTAPAHLVTSLDSKQQRTVELAATAHFIGSGSQGVLDLATGTWQFQLPGKQANVRRPLSSQASGDWRDQTRRNCGSQQVIAWQQYDYRFQLKPSDDTRFYLANSNADQGGQCSYTYLPFTINYQE